jgi:peptidoglycan/LPS O-acetylase OafA/YrhL
VALVIVCHLAAFSSISSPRVAWLGHLGGLGVEYFFVISGFVIVRGLLREEPISLRAFYVRRFFRIIPPLFLYLIAVTGLALAGAMPLDLARFWRAATFTCNDGVSGPVCTHLGGHTWSLSVEEQFYLVIPALAALSGRALRVVALGLGPVVIGLYALKFDHAAELLMPFVFIATGVACAIWEEAIRGVVRRVHWSAALAAFGASVALKYLPPTALDTAIQTLALPLVVASTLMVSSLSRAPAVILTAAPLRSLGVASYSIYLWQQLATYAWPGATGWFYVASVGGCIAWALVSYRFIERPLIRLGAQLSDRLRRPVQTAEAAASSSLT